MDVPKTLCSCTPQYAHENGGPVLVSVLIAAPDYPKPWAQSVRVPIEQVPALIASLQALTPIGTPIPSDAEVSRTTIAKKPGLLRRIFS